MEQNATILFSQNTADYLPVVFTRWQGIELMNYSPFVYCYGQHNVAVTGAGTLNGQADANHWWKQMIQPFASDTVLLEGVTVINSPFWHLNPNLCTNVTVDGLTISSTGPNTDGHGGITIGSAGNGVATPPGGLSGNLVGTLGTGDAAAGS